MRFAANDVNAGCKRNKAPSRLTSFGHKAGRRIVLSAALMMVLFVSSIQAQEVRPDHANRMQSGTRLFKESIRQTLTIHCLKCHGGEKVRGGFDMGTRELLLAGGDSGVVVDIESPEDSYLLMLVRHDEEPTMPPSEVKLSDKLVGDIERWIALGAPFDKPLIEPSAVEKSAAMTVTQSDREFWSFTPLAEIQAPLVEGTWPVNAIDRFVLEKLQAQGLTPNDPADDRTRIRRAYLDVIGLPPTLPQLDAALKMTHEELIDNLLASPHYGERWARHWLDAARFGESHGFEQDTDRNFAFHYRDFVIKALNQDMPWDQFVRWQLAGDELAPEAPHALMATGFLGAGVFPTQLTENEFEIARYDELDDMAATTGTAMLGMTIGCARCHDHKFDPLPVKDYYQFVSTFTTTIRSEIDATLDKEKYLKDLAKWKTDRKVLTTRRDEYLINPKTVTAFESWLAHIDVFERETKDWNFLDFTKTESDHDSTTLTLQSDGAILATGVPANHETYVLRANIVSQPVRFVRLEALTHTSLQRNGPGRAGNGNFGLGDFRVYVNNKPTPVDGSSTTSKANRRPLKLRAYKFTHEQNGKNLSVAASVNDTAANTGWAVDAGGIGENQAAIFELEEPLGFDGEVELEFQLDFGVNTAHSLGRFRISTSSLDAPSLVIGDGQNESLAKALAALKQKRMQPNHRETLLRAFLQSDESFRQIEQRVQESLVDKPAPKKTKIQVSSEGLPGIKHLAAGRGFKHYYPETHFLHRGDPNQKAGVAEPGFLQVLMRNGKTNAHWKTPPPSGWTRTSFRRAGLANWITDTEHGAGHLLARVAVNRVWHHHFGKGIVATPNDFGLQGTRPTHPKLLDFLARELIKNGWSIKKLHREILLSSTWLQSSESSHEKFTIDPENNFLWKFNPRRLEAEAIRDSLLSVAGQLDPRMFGKGTLAPDHRRRSIYFTIKRSQLIPMMQIFDQPEPLSSQGGRPATTIAPQALLFMNNKQVLEWASDFAGDVVSHKNDEAVKEIYLRTLARVPTTLELEQSIAFVNEQANSYKINARQQALADLCQVMFGLNEFIFVR